MSLEFLLGRML
jgi:glycogen phosphorylase